MSNNRSGIFLRLFRQSLTVAVLSIVLQSCGGHSTRPQNDADSIHLTDARLLHISMYHNVMLVSIDDPWHQGRTLAKYALIEHKDSSRVGLPDGFVPIYVPLHRSVVATSSHANLLLMLGVADKISGVCDGQYIITPKLRSLIHRGIIKDCGASFSPNTERIVAMGVDAMLVSPFEDNPSASISKHTGIPIIECADYMEATPLGRAEWMKFYGRLYGCADRADSLYNEVKQAYNKLRTLAQQSKNRPKVLTETVYESVWYCPGGHSTKAQIVADAGGKYAFRDNDKAGSLPLQAERVIAEASDADVWTFTAPTVPTRRQLLSAYRGYKMIKAVNQGRVYACPSMSVTYFDDVAFRPDWHLKEYIAMLHPELITDYKLRYYRQISE